MIIIPQLKLGYQNIPKVATTSLFGWLYDCCNIGNRMPLEPQRMGNHKRRYFLSGKSGPLRIENRTETVEPFTDFFRFAITRDPIKRFLSMYRNRVVFRRELSATAGCADALRAARLRFDPGLDEMVFRLEEYLACSPVIFHHARPMMDFVGPDLSVYTRIADLSEVNHVVAEIRGFWRSNDLRDKIADDPTIQLGRHQTRGPMYSLSDLSPDSFNRLLSYYRRDYKSIPTISVLQIQREYGMIRSSMKHRSR